MTFERPEHVRYEPRTPLSALLLWQDESGRRQSAAQVKDMSQGSCALQIVDAPLVGMLALVGELK